jgi:hypothetical protein
MKPSLRTLIPPSDILQKLRSTTCGEQEKYTFPLEIHFKDHKKGQAWWWLTPVIPATWEAEIRRLIVQGQPGQKVNNVQLRKLSGGGSGREKGEKKVY